MPAGSPIGSGQGVLNPNALRICLEYLKENDPDYPVIVDAGVGTASDVTVAMELGADGVLLNTGIAHAKDPLRHGPRDASGLRVGPAGVSFRPDSEEALRHRQQPHRGPHFAARRAIGAKCVGVAVSTCRTCLAGNLLRRQCNCYPQQSWNGIHSVPHSWHGPHAWE